MLYTWPKWTSGSCTYLLPVALDPHSYSSWSLIRDQVISLVIVFFIRLYNFNQRVGGWITSVPAKNTSRTVLHYRPGPPHSHLLLLSCIVSLRRHSLVWLYRADRLRCLDDHFKRLLIQHMSKTWARSRDEALVQSRQAKTSQSTDFSPQTSFPTCSYCCYSCLRSV